MPDSPAPDALPLLDLAVLLVCVAGAILGAAAGLKRAFALLLWTLAALWLGHHLSARVVDWMPNSLDPSDPSARAGLELPTFLIIAGVVLALPLAGKLFGGPSGKKKAKDKGRHRVLGAVTGLVVTVLLVVMALPFVLEVPGVGPAAARSTSAACASGVAEHVTWLYPEAHRGALRAAAG